jgi:hypothetical protein
MTVQRDSVPPTVWARSPLRNAGAGPDRPSRGPGSTVCGPRVHCCGAAGSPALGPGDQGISIVETVASAL